ncbi:MAG: SPOR domain-containing protein [Mariprofundaceae bacterium]|nr:SPOR domain-containing protein [Mariprofundaceae bacterium]
MAGRDFARIEAVVDESVQDERPVRQTTIVLLIGLSVVVLMAAFSGGFWLGRDQGAEIASSQDKARLQALIQKQKNELENLRLVAKQRHKADEVSMTQVGDLMFYNDLPHQSVTPSALHQGKEKQKLSPEILKIRDMIHQEIEQQPILGTKKTEAVQAVLFANPSHVKKTVMVVQQYYQIQLASFQKDLDAAVFTQKMDAKSVKTRIQEVQLPKLGTWYRVYTGNYMDKKQAMKALLKLKDDIHVTGLVVKR